MVAVGGRDGAGMGGSDHEAASGGGSRNKQIIMSNTMSNKIRTNEEKW